MVGSIELLIPGIESLVPEMMRSALTAWSIALVTDFVSEAPKDEKGLADVGAYYLLNGDRATAESLFDRSFERKDELWATVSAAGAYLGVPPQE